MLKSALEMRWDGDEMKGYKNCVLRIDLSSKNISKEKLNMEYVKRYLGGEGYGVALLWDEVPHDTEPLSEKNILSFNTGPLTGTPMASASRISINFLSPLSNTIGSSNMGSHFGAEVKFAGYDSIIFEGKADKPVIVVIENDKVEIKDAAHLWGKNTRETTEILNEELGKEYKISCIGQGGENLSSIACIFSDDCFAGRGGAGAVMGSKNLKAVAVKGNGKIEINDKDKFLEINAVAIREIRDEVYTWGPVHGYGTPAWLDGANECGLLPTRNFRQNQFEKLEPIMPTQLWNNREKFEVRRRACYSCQLGCHKYIVMKNSDYGDDIGVGELEFETIAALGPRCGVNSYEDISMANYYLTIYGLDTISGGATISAAMEWYEEGIITSDDLDGLELNFGNGKAMVELLRKMGLREGCGDLFADGSQVAAEKIGKRALDYTMTVKGMEIPATDPRGSSAMTVSLGTSERGACHMRPYAATIDAFGYLYPDLGVTEPKDPFDDKESKEWLKSVKEFFVVTNLIGICDFNVINCELHATTLAAIYTALTGIETDKEELLRKAERTIALERALNYERGFRRDDDRLPKRFMTEEASGGPPKGRKVDMESALDKYYEACSYDKEKAIPTKEKFKSLGMEDVYNGLLANK